jgi:hypothetical protein
MIGEELKIVQAGVDPKIAQLAGQIRDYLLSVHNVAKGSTLGGPMAKVMQRHLEGQELSDHFEMSAFAMLGDIRKVFESIPQAPK